MSDLELAMELLESKEFTLVVVKDGKVIYKSNKRGIYPIYKLVTVFSNKIKGASLADKVIGRAAAMLCKKAGIKLVYTDLISKPAIKLLNGIELEYKKAVPHILNREKNDRCPMEKLSVEVDNVQELILKIEEFLKKNGSL